MNSGRLLRVLPAVLVALCVGLAACQRSNDSRFDKSVIVLGVDGMDPGFVERHWDSLPNLSALRRQGSFSRLGTTMPPQSPVAWSTFTTGLAPAEHGIFDFVQRHPSTLAAYSSMGETEDPAFVLPLGPYQLPLVRPRITSFRKGTPFWQLLSKQGVPVTVVRMPNNFPPEGGGNALSGMGTPDLKGTLGTFSFYTDDPEDLSRSVPGGNIVKVSIDRGRVAFPVQGPPNSLRKDRRPSSIELIVDVDPERPVARFSIQDEVFIVQQGEWSPWITADFPLLSNLVSVRGMFRVFARQIHPQLELYVSPVNVDPISPALPISNPRTYSHEIARDIGRYSTLGIPEDTSALRQHVFELPEFLAQTRLVLREEEKLLEYSLGHFHGGLLFFYFSSVDQNSHILWQAHERELLEYYRAIDANIGEVRKRQPAAELIILSDHGFATFSRAVHLNTWLEKEGFLASRGGEGFAANGSIDWSRTTAYALGLNAVYLNLAGREKYGMVQPTSRRNVLDRLRDRLLSFRDPQNGNRVIETVQLVVPAPQNASAAPDLIVGYAPGYRASWQTGLGESPPALIEDNDDPWIGDHCINPADIPGVLFTTHPIRLPNPKLQDVTVSVLNLFGVKPHAGISGRTIY